MLIPKGRFPRHSLASGPTWLALPIAALVLLLPAVADADPAASLAQPAAEARSPWSFGFRVGGYGFREVSASDGHSGWDDCRMNGLGLFAERALSDEHFFLQSGIDLYFSDSFPESGPAGGTGMDRYSMLTTIAAGVRLWPRALFSPHLQLGAGLELTHVELPSSGRSGAFAAPLGFLGVGGDLGLGDHLRLGLTLRALIMANFEHDGGEQGLEPQYTPAAQVQLYARYDL
jgi:hypothetical protein